MKVLTISPSTLDRIDMCLRLYWYTSRRRLSPFVRDKKLDQGGLLHIMMYSHYRDVGLNLNRDPRKRMDDIMEEAINNGIVAAASSDLKPDTISNCIEVYRAYVRYYPEDAWVPLLDKKGVPLVEVPVSKLIFERPDSEEGEGVQIIFIGKIDMILAPHGEVSEPTIVDHKSYERYWEFSPLQNQLTGYSAATGIRNVARNTLGFQKEGNENKFRRSLFRYTISQQDEWKRWAVYRVLQTDLNNELGSYPPNLTSCDKFGGCHFKKACQEPPEFREMYINAHYWTRDHADIYQKPLPEPDDKKAVVHPVQEAPTTHAGTEVRSAPRLPVQGDPVTPSNESDAGSGSEITKETPADEILKKLGLR